MNIAFFIAKRLSATKESSFSSSVHKIAVAGIAIGLGTMIVSFLILGGFKKSITNKLFSLSGHIRIMKYTLESSFEEEPISTNNIVFQQPEKFPFIAHIDEYAHKAGLIKTEEEVQGVILKGVGSLKSMDKIKSSLVEGELINFKPNGYSNEILISKKTANQLKLAPNDEILMYFLQNPPRYRKLLVKGIYNTGLEDYDEKIVIGDIRLIRRLNNWQDTLAGGFEVYLNKFSQLDTAASILSKKAGYDMYVEKITERFIQIFDWLKLLNRNVAIFLGLILFVACFNMVSILFILIMERTNMIGVLKALGASNNQIREIFVFNGMWLILKGLLWGNFIALGFGFIQYYFKVIPLDPENYYMSFVPIQWNWQIIIFLNLFTFVIVSLSLLLPVIIISRIRPVKAIRFD